VLSPKEMDALQAIMRREGRLISLSADRPTVFVGDTHGDADATHEVLRRWSPRVHVLVFLGDYVDRGADSQGNLQTLLHAKREHPEHVVLLMGNHEGWAVTPFSPADFWQRMRPDESQAWGAFLSDLPLAAHHPAGVLAVHGALPDVSDVSEIAGLELGSADWRKITWGDWADVPGAVVDPGIHGRPTFGRDYFREVTARLKLKVVVRSHQPHAPTYLFDDRCLTLFTSNAYGTTRHVALLHPERPPRTARDLTLIEL